MGLAPQQLSCINQHIAASKGSENCVLLLLDYGADPNRKDNDGSVPLWEAIIGKHVEVIKLLVNNGASLSSGDTGQFACFAAEQNGMDLLKSIFDYGGDVTVPQQWEYRNTPLHVAVSEGNTEVAKFLLDKGADIDKPNIHGWTPQALADQQGHEDIIALFNVRDACIDDTSTRTKFSREPSIPHVTNGGSSRNNARSRRKPRNFPNSLFGIVTAAHDNSSNRQISTISSRRGLGDNTPPPPRVTISCPEKSNIRKFVLLPGSMEELLEAGAQKFGVLLAKVLTIDKAEIDEVELIRDGDHLLLVSKDWIG